MIKRLPLVPCKLYNLHTLLLSDCSHRTKLLEDIGKLVNLHHFVITNTYLKEFPKQIAKLQNLQKLSNLIVSKKLDGLKVVEIGKFPFYKGSILP